MVRRDEKTDNDEKEDDVEYLENIIDKLIKLKKHWTKKNQCHDHNIKTAKYLSIDFNDDSALYPINDQQYEFYSNKVSLKLDKYLEMIKISKNCKSLTLNYVFRSKKDQNHKQLCVLK